MSSSTVQPDQVVVVTSRQIVKVVYPNKEVTTIGETIRTNHGGISFNPVDLIKKSP